MKINMKTKTLTIFVVILSLMISGCVKDELFTGKPILKDLAISPQSPTITDIVTVSVKVTDADGPKAVLLYFKIDEGSFTNVSMSLQNGSYKAEIPAQADGVTVNYYVEAENNSGVKAYAPEGAPTVTSSYTVGAPLILMNEIYSRGTIEAPDWVEIYNGSENPADISGYKIYDAGGQSGGKLKMEFPTGSVIPGHGFIVIVVDDGTESGFGISSGGDEIWFENTTGNVIDNIACPAMETTQSFGRVPDGGATWQLLNEITRGTANSSELPEPIILINELYSTGTTENPDWVEVYNASAFEANIGGYKIYDSGGQSGSKPKKEFPAGTVIPSHGFAIIVVDDAAESGFGLSSSGEQIWIENTSSVVADDVTFPALETGTSYGRFADGTENWITMGTVTPGAANSDVVPVYAKPMINEVFSNGVAGAETGDWIEIYNDSDVPLNLTGYKVYDSGGQTGTKPKKLFPDGLTLAGHSFIVIVTDDDTESGFGLSGNGEKVWFEDATGILVDSVEFPALELTQSFGRFPDGTANLQILNTITRGTANNNSTPLEVIVLMNEVNALGTTEDPDWIEIYNDSDFDVDLTGYKIYDSGGQSGTIAKKEFPSGTIIPSKAWYAITTKDGAADEFGLSSSGEKLWLENATGAIIDSVEFPATEGTQTYGRYPDGSANWQLLYIPTKGAANNASMPTAVVVMNEIYSRGTAGAETGDWVEIYNDSDIDADISGWFIYDSGGQGGTKPKKAFPAGTIIPAKGFYVIVTDDDNVDGSGFGLSSGGEQIWFEKADGTIMDNVTFPAMETTQSYGRQPDGTVNWMLLNTITRGTSNNVTSR
jgi:hypothetical protein